MLKFILIISTLFISTITQASVVIMGTRVIYPAEQTSINVQLNNADSSPSLIQSWIDNGNASASPDSMAVPFVITPPIFRIEPTSGQTLRIMYTGEPLPQDRESLFYLNVLDIPAKPKVEENTEINNSNNYLQIAVRSRIKLFFRPNNLKIAPSDAYEQVAWHLEETTTNSVLKADNPTPYFITYNQISINQEGAHPIKIQQTGMIAPFSSESFPLSKKITSSEKVNWIIVNDYGGYQKGESLLK